MEGAVYLLCAATAFVCGILLLRGWLRKRVRLLLWCCLFFVALAVENAILFVDVVLLPMTDISLLRNLVAFLGISVLLIGLVWDAK